MTRNHTSINRVLLFVCLGIALLIVLLPLAAQAAPAAIPPVPTRAPTVTSTPTSTPAPVPPAPAPASTSDDGGRIELRAEFPKTWYKTGIHWQNLWTVVQWQDDPGVWRNVEGWQGTLDEVQDGVGRKEWWVAGRDLGKGPFRWVVYQGQGGGPLATSESFYLPDDVGRITQIGVTVQP